MAQETMLTMASRFQEAASDRRIRSVIMAVGDGGSGKTTFALSGPMPTLYQAMDNDLEGIVEPLIAEGKKIYVAEYDWAPGRIADPKNLQEIAIELRDKFVADFEAALDAGVRNIVWNKENDVWEMFRYAEFGKPNDNPKDYAKLNQRYVALINRVKAYDASLIMIDALKEDWGQVGPINSQGKRSLAKTGAKSRKGFDRLEEFVFAELYFRSGPSEDPDAPGAAFEIDVKKCRQNTALQYQTFQGMRFSEFGTLLIPGTTEEDWS